MISILEGLLHVPVIRKVFHVENKRPSFNAGQAVDSHEQIALRNSIKKKAHIIAGNVRNYGEQKFGPMWAQGYAVLLDGRIVFLQQSLGEIQVGETLEINIPPTTNDPYSIHIRYDLGRDEINTYEMRQEDSEPIIAYGIYDRPNYTTEVATNLMLHDILVPVDEILQSVEVVSNRITWTQPNPTIVITK